MTDFHYWDPYFRDNKYPCYVRDIQSEEIIYANSEFFKAFQCDESIIGEKFYNVVALQTVDFDHVNDSILANNDYEFNFYHKQSNQYCRGAAHLIRDNRSIFCQCRILLDEDSEIEKALTRCTEIYQLPLGQVLPSLMELLCNFYHATRAFVHRFNYNDNTIHPVVQWQKEDRYCVLERVITPPNSEILTKYLVENQMDGSFHVDLCDDSFDNVHIKEILTNMHIENMMLSTVEDVNKTIIGVVGVCNSNQISEKFDHRLLQTIARFVAQDVTKGIMDAEMFQLHHRDALTGFYNRVGYAKQVDKILESKPKSLGVISANINGLKNINENAGISGGDEHIKLSAHRMKSFFGFLFFRMSGDEFLGLAPNVGKAEFEEKVVELHALLKEENNYDFSFGHAWCDGKFHLPKLIFEAETIMYINKQDYYAKSNRTFDSVNNTILADLLSYLENDEFMIYLQPQVHLNDGSLYGAEALIRRFDKTQKKMVFPDQFIPLYEQKSVIRHVDIFVVEQVCQLLSRWHKMGKAIPISVNLSRVTLQEYGIVGTIVRICDKYNVPHHLLVIEVTERVGLIENNVASALITSFKDYGFMISLDDFGCAYSNIVTLAQIEVDEVKIDKSLVDDLTTSKKNRILVKNVLSMCQELEGASTLAEGIEDEEQANLLHQLGCHLGQGYFYSRPIPVDEFIEKYINENTPVTNLI